MAEILKFPTSKVEKAKVVAKAQKRLKKLIKSGFLQVVQVQGNPHFVIECEKIEEWIDKGTIEGKALKGDLAETVDRLILTTINLVMLKGTEYALNGKEIEEFYINRLSKGDKNFFEWQNRQCQKAAKGLKKQCQ